MDCAIHTLNLYLKWRLGHNSNTIEVHKDTMFGVNLIGHLTLVDSGLEGQTLD